MGGVQFTTGCALGVVGTGAEVLEEPEDCFQDWAKI